MTPVSRPLRAPRAASRSSVLSSSASWRVLVISPLLALLWLAVLWAWAGGVA